MKCDYKSIIEEIKKEDESFLRTEPISDKTFFIDCASSVYNMRGVATFRWYWNSDLYKLALGFKEYAIRQLIVELNPACLEDFDAEFKKSLGYTLPEYINEIMMKIAPKECIHSLNELLEYFDKYEKMIENENFNKRYFADLLSEWDKLSYQLVTNTRTHLWDDYNEVVSYLANSFDIYPEEEEREDGTATIDLEDLKEKLINC